MSEPDVYPLAQAAFVLREPVSEVRKIVERRNIPCRSVSLGGRNVRAVDRKTLVFLSWNHEQSPLISAALRRAVFEGLQGHDHLPSRVDVGGLTAWFEDAAKRVSARLATLRDLEGQVATNAAGEPVLRGTGIEVHRIAALLGGGMTVEEVCEDYPSLSADQIAFAETYAAAHPKQGRPYPRLTVKRAMRQADLSGLDLED